MSDEQSIKMIEGFQALEIQRASPAETRLLLALRNELAHWMVENCIEQWRPGEMDPIQIGQQIAASEIYVVRENDHVVASVSIGWSDELVWDKQVEPSGYIHGLMVSRSHAGRAIGRWLLGWSETHISEVGRSLARLDCVRANGKLRRYYERAGYSLVGYRDFGDVGVAALSGAIPAETTLYEKVLVG